MASVHREESGPAISSEDAVAMRPDFIGRSGTGPRSQGDVSGAAPSRPELACWSLADNTGGASLRFPLVIFMFVKKASDSLLQLRRLARLAHGHDVLEKLLLDGCRQIIPLQEYRRPKALQDTPLIL
jgi:hypothetical protein